MTGFYTGWLLPAAVVGVLVFLYGVATMDMNQIALEVCNEGNKYEVQSCNHGFRLTKRDEYFGSLLPTFKGRAIF